MITIIELKISLRENHMKYPLFCSYGQVESRSNVRLTSGQWNVRKGEMIIYVAEISTMTGLFVCIPPVFFHLASLYLFLLLLLLLLLLVVVVVVVVMVFFCYFFRVSSLVRPTGIFRCVFSVRLCGLRVCQ